MQKTPLNKTIRIAIAGNPNTGKTSLFNLLTGEKQHVGNYPGVTVEKKVGLINLEDKTFEIVDLPGTYSLTAYSLEEIVTRDFVIESKPDAVVDVMDSTNLERNLYLCLQFQELGVPVVGVLNMTDEAEKRGIYIDEKHLGSILGIPMVKTVASKNKGKKELLSEISKLMEGNLDSTIRHLNYGEELESLHTTIIESLGTDPAFAKKYPLHWMSIKLLEKDADAIRKVKNEHADWEKVLKVASQSCDWIQNHFGEDSVVVVGEQRYAYIHGACRETVEIHTSSPRIDVTEAIDKIVLNRFFGVLAFFIVMFGIYALTFKLGSPISELLASLFGFLGATIHNLLPQGTLNDFIVTGVIGGVGGVLGFIPIIILLFLGLSFLEDTGYMCRAAFVMDKFLHTFGLHGRSFIPLIISTGCAVPGVMSARTLVNTKDRILTVLVAPLMLCGAKTPVIVILLSAFFPDSAAVIFVGIWFLGWILAFIVAFVLRKLLFKDKDSPLVMELPPYRIPTFNGVMLHMWQRAWEYVKKAGTVILAASIIVWFLLSFPKPVSYSKDYEAWKQKLKDEYSMNQKALDKEERREVVEVKSPLGKSIYISRSEQLQKNLTRELSKIESQIARENLAASMGGHIGKWIYHVFQPCGFDWKITLAILSGIAGKETIISTLSIAYGVEETEPEAGETSLRQKLITDPEYNPLMALAFMVFVLTYTPCLPTIVAVKRELGSWKWPILMIFYTLFVAWILATVIFQGGRILGF